MMEMLQTRSPRNGGNRARAGRKQVQHPDDSEALTLRQDGRLCRLYPVSLEVAPTLASEYPLNRHELFRGEITERGGVQVVSIGRWKVAADGTRRRAGPALEVGCHRLAGIIRLVADLQRIVEDRQKELDAAPGRASA